MHSRKFPLATLFDIQFRLRLSAFQPTPMRPRHSALSTLFPYWPLSPFLFMFASPLSLSLSRHARTFTSTAFWPRELARLVEGLLPVRAEISVRKFRSLAASESATKLNINLPDYSDAILCPSVPLRSLSCLFLSLDTNPRIGSSVEETSDLLQSPIAKNCQKDEIDYFYDKSVNILSLKSS